MTRDEVLVLALRIYDEYMPNDNVVDNDLKTFIDGFLDDYVEPFINTISLKNIIPLVRLVSSIDNIIPINYKGGCFVLPHDFQRLIEFKYNTWQRSVYENEVIDNTVYRRKLQENKFTAGNISKPVVSIEYNNGSLCLCFWGYDKNSSDQTIYLTYVKKCIKLEDMLVLEDWLITAYIYYVMSFIFITTKNVEMSEHMISKSLELLASFDSQITLPVKFNNEKQKK